MTEVKFSEETGPKANGGKRGTTIASYYLGNTLVSMFSNAQFLMALSKDFKVLKVYKNKSEIPKEVLAKATCNIELFKAKEKICER